MSDFASHRKCDICKSTFVNGVPHTCDADESLDAARNKLEKWLGEWTLES